MPGELYIFPTSFAQQRLWFLDQMVPGNSFYNLSAAIRLFFPVNIVVFKKCLNEILRRHETLRTTFKAVDGQPFQVIASHLEIDLPIHDLTHLAGEGRQFSVQELVNKDARVPFDLANGPLMRTSLIKLSHSEFVFLLSMHHIVSDGWCRYLFFKELTVLYESFLSGKPSPLPELQIQYADYAVWQQEYLHGKVLEDHLSYWKQKLSNLSPLMLPIDKPRPVLQSFQGSSEMVELSKSLSDSIRKISIRENVTIFMTLLAAFKALLHRYSRQDDIVVGVPVAGRNHLETENLIGFFVNSLVIRTDFSVNPTFTDLLQQVKYSTLEAFAHQELPFEKLVEELHPERDLSRNPLFQVTFQFLQFPTLPGEDIERGSTFLGADKGTAIFDLRLSFAERNEIITGEIEYSSDLFEQATIQRMAGHFRTLLAKAIENPQEQVSRILFLSNAEQYQLLLGWNNVVTQPLSRQSLHELVEQQVLRSANAIAIIYKDHFLTYDDLNKQSNCLARYLRSAGIKEESFVGVCLERSEKMIIAFLAILKAGAGYIPMDPSYPKDRIQMITDDSGMNALISERDLLDELINAECPVVYLEEEWPQIIKEKNTDLNLNVDPLNIAYIIYTSGSTGIPKGVLISHGAICNHMLWMNATFPLIASDIVMQRTPYSFDASIWEFYAPLIAGARLLIAENEGNKDPDYIIKSIISASVSVIQVVPSMLKALLSHPQMERCTSLKRVYCGGEPLPSSLIMLFYNSLNAELFNLYGPTEATIDATFWHCCIENNKERVPIGRPIFNTQLYVLDLLLSPVSVGTPGELWIGGEGLARGYLKNPSLTAKNFLPDPFSKKPGSRMYRTGDTVRYRSDGNLEYIERVDNQIKLRGYRIEPGEIEHTLEKHPNVKDCVVLTQRVDNINEKLIAYIVPDYSGIGDSGKGMDWAAAHVHQWKKIYDEKIYGLSLLEETAGFHVTSWSNAYCGRLISKDEIDDWLKVTVQDILALKPRKVLEIGCGTGLILSGIAPFCGEYTGTDISSSAIDYLNGHLLKIGLKLPNVCLLERAADNFEGWKKDAFDTIILNSVLQYFPDIDYLSNVLEKAVNLLPKCGTVFINNVRSLPLIDSFYLYTELLTDDGRTRTEKSGQRINRNPESERELVVDPEFFICFGKKIPRISNVEIRMKKGKYDNAITMFRYDVIIEIGKEEINGPLESLDWAAGHFTFEKLENLLRLNSKPDMVISNIPDSRLLKYLNALNLTAASFLTEIDSADLLNESSTESCHPNRIRVLQELYPYNIQIGWWSTYKKGCYEVRITSKTHTTQRSPRSLLREKKSSSQDWREYANNPLQYMFNQSLISNITGFLVERLPYYMIPADYKLLDKIPLKPNGKIDSIALPKPGNDKPAFKENYAAPENSLEKAIAEIWSQVLNNDQIGTNDHFFKDLGGHSLLATQLTSRVRDRFGIEVTLQTIFKAPTIRAFSEIIDGLLAKETKFTEALTF